MLLIYIKPNYPAWIFYTALFSLAAGWLFVFKRSKHRTWFFLSFFLMLLFIWFTLQVSFVQNWIVKRVATGLSEKLNASISIRHIDYSFFDKMDLQGLLVKDRKQDTLLFAGSTKVNISDWFFLKTKPVISYVELQDATVDMHRTDSVWNYQFLIDFFSSPKKNTEKKRGFEFDLKELKLSNVTFKQIDEWKGRNMIVSLKDLHLLVDGIDLDKKKMSINKLDINAPRYRQYDYKGIRDKLNIPDPVKLIDSSNKSNNDGWIIAAQNIHISNGIFDNGDENEPAHEGRFDSRHIRFTEIMADLKNVHFERDSLTTDIKLSTKEHSGFEVKKLQAKVKFTSTIMEFNELELVTNKSRLGNYYSMQFKNFNDDMGNFLHKIMLEGRFINSELSSDDLAFFAPELASWKRMFHIKGNAKGTIDNMTAKKMLIKTNNSLLDGDISLKGLPDIDNTFIDFRANELQTTFADLVGIIPALKDITEPNLNRLGAINYQGNYTGFINDFVAFGTISTSLGTVAGDINLKLPKNKPAVYSGRILTRGFRLGDFLNNGDLGAIVFNGKVKGSGFSSKNLDANFDGNVHSIEYAGYNYQNIILDGDFKKKLFHGHASINDPNLAVEYLNGTINFDEKQPQFDFDAQLNKANFKKLKLTNDDYELKGHFNLNFTGNNIDNFLGTAKITDAALTHNQAPLSFDSLILQSQAEDGQKYLSLHSNEIDAHVKGNFKILDLPDAFKIFLSRYYPAYIKKPSNISEDQNFSFDIKTKNIDPYIQLIDPKLKGFDNTSIEGNLRLKENELDVTADVPAFSYDNKLFTNISLQSHGNMDTLATKITVDDIAINDSLHLPNTNLVFNSFNDTSDISIKTSASKTISEAAINARLITMSNGINVHFFPSSFIINDKKWQLEKDGEITFRNKNISANEVKFIQGNQQITIATEPSSIGNSDDILVKLDNVSIDDFTSLAFPDPKLEGLATGTVRISDPFGKPYMEFETTTQQLRSGKDSIGELNITGSYNIGSGEIKFKGKSDKNPENLLDVDGSINLKDSSNNQTMIAIKSEKFDLALLNNYLGDLFTDIKGFANTTDLSFSGNLKHLMLTGTANIDEGSLIVNFTQCKYKFKNESIVFNPDEIDFGNITLSDTLNNTASLSGKIYHQFFKNTEFDNIKLETNRMLVLNTTKKDNSQFYGKVIGKAKMTINGNQDNILMNISGEPSRIDSSHIYIISGNSIENGTIDYIDFIQFGNKMEENFKTRSAGNILVNMELTANPSCKIDVILDETTGDIIKGEGEGLLKISVGNREPLTINGRYDITKGEYTFNFQTFLKKYFTVNSGSLVWDGDPYKAKIDILAEYLATKVNFSSLAPPASVPGSTTFDQRSDLRVVAHLTETLLKPKIQFELILPQGSPITDFLILKKLEQFKQDENDLNKQVTSLLLFNSFINTNQGFITAGSGYNVISSTIGGVVSSAISGFFNKFLQQYIKNLTVNIDVNSSYGSAYGGNDLQANVNKLQAAAKSNFVYTLMNGRLIITAGINLDYNNPYVTSTRNNNVLVTPDITAEWILTKDGKVRVVGFNRTNYDLVGQRNRTGISLAYRKEVDKFSQILKRSPDKAKQKQAKK